MYNAAGPSGVPPHNAVSSNGTPDPIPTLRMSRVVSNQKFKFENDVIFQKLSTDCAISYTGERNKNQNERQFGFYNLCCQGQTEITFKSTGMCLHLVFNANVGPSTQEIDCDFSREPGRVHIKSRLLMDGVCVKFRGWLDCNSLDGVGCLEFDEERAFHEVSIGKNVHQQHIQILLDFEKRQRAYLAQRRMAAVNGGGSNSKGNRSR